MGVYYSHYIIPRDNTVRPSPQQIIRLIEAWRMDGYVPKTASGENERVSPRFKIDAWEGAHRAFKDERSQLLVEKTNRSALGRLFPNWYLSRLRARTPRASYHAPMKPFSYPPKGDSLAALSDLGALIEWRMNDYLKLGTIYPMQTSPEPQWAPSYSLELHIVDDFINMDDGYSGCGKLNTVCNCGQQLEYVSIGIPFDETRIRKTCSSCGRAFRPQDQIIELMEGATGTRFMQQGGLCYRFAIVVRCGKDFPGSADSEPPRDPRVRAVFMQTCAGALGAELYEVSHYS